MTFILTLCLDNHLCKTYFNDVENNILVKAVKDALGYAVVIPGSVDEQQILQVFELCRREAQGRTATR